jgi:hypothetical protein
VFSDAIALALKQVTAITGGATSEVVPVVSSTKLEGKRPPCIDGTDPAFAILAFSPKPGGKKAADLANRVIGGFMSPQVRVF